jgi:hypothetical protein
LRVNQISAPFAGLRPFHAAFCRFLVYFFCGLQPCSSVSASSVRSRLETLRWRYESERRRGSTQTTLGLLALCALALALFGNVFLYLISSSTVPALVRVPLFLTGVLSLIIGGVFLARALLGSIPGGDAGAELRIHPGMGSLSSPDDRAAENLSTQYAAAAGAFARRNELRGRDLTIGGWSLIGGILLPLILLIWMLLAAGGSNRAFSAGGGFFASGSKHPAEISQDRSPIPLQSAGTRTDDSRAASGRAGNDPRNPGDSEIDGACCLFEDRRPTR